MKRYRLENEHLIVEFLALGGTIIKIEKKKNHTNYVLAYHSMQDYYENPYYMGSLIGRVAGRVYPPYYQDALLIRRELEQNENQCCLHGGSEGFYRRIWQVELISTTLARLSLEDDSNIYGKARFVVDYRLDKNQFIIEIKGESGEPTLMNMTSHLYFNLNQNKEDSVENHYLQINSQAIQKVDSHCIPLNETIEKTSLDANYYFLTPKKVKAAFEQATDLVQWCHNGIDLAYCFEQDQPLLEPLVVVWSDDGTNGLQIRTDQECCVVYTLNKITERYTLTTNIPIYKYGGITFEMQRRPNYVHLDSKSSLQKMYGQTTIYEIL